MRDAFQIKAKTMWRLQAAEIGMARRDMSSFVYKPWSINSETAAELSVKRNSLKVIAVVGWASWPAYDGLNSKLVIKCLSVVD